MNGFRLISLELKDSLEFDAGFYQFSNDDISSNNKFPYQTLLIGPNGTGKSRLLKIVLDIFNDLYNYKISGNDEYQFKNYYKLIYLIGKNKFEIENSRTISIRKNGKETTLTKIELPQKAIAAAYSLYEKFTPKSPIRLSKFDTRKKGRYDNEFYEYLGLKSDRNYTFSGSYITKSMDMITEALANEGFNKEVSHVFKVLSFLPKISIRYRIKNQELFAGNITVSRLRKILSNSSYEKAGFNFGTYKRLEDSPIEYLEQIVEALNVSSFDFGPKFQLPLELIFEQWGAHDSFRKKYKNLSLLRSLNFIHHKEIIVYKRVRGENNAVPMDIKSMSSGEIQILTSMLALISVVKENSLVLIDEPEISLHPNWQLQYVDILNKVFAKCGSCHFLIASHSHFLVSDLKEFSSSILSLRSNQKLETVSEFLDYSTEGWSAENILYNVFGVATVRNHYFDMDLRELLKLISSKKGNKEQIQKYIQKFEKFKTLPHDPLNLLIKSAKTYLNEN